MSDALVAHLLDHSVRVGDFTLKSGAKSTWFIDGKQTLCRPAGLLLVAEAMDQVIPDGTTAIGGMTMGADPLAFGVAGYLTDTRSLRTFSVRREPKDHGIMGSIAGVLEPADKVVVVEDVATRGTSILKAVQAVEKAGATVVAAIAMVDRGGTSGALLALEGIPFIALVTAPDLGFAYEGGFVFAEAEPL